MRHLKTFLFCIALIVLYSCAEKEAHTIPENDTLFQVATLQSLMTGNFGGYIPVAELLKHGDTGLGTFHHLDGEMIVLDGSVYQAKSDGSVSLCNDSVTSPFSTVTFFDSDTSLTIQSSKNSPISLAQLSDKLNEAISAHGKNMIYILKLHIDNCDSVLVRSAKPQTEPYRQLQDVISTDQVLFPYTNLSGTIIGVYFPEYYAQLNATGWHFHFISDDRTKGGHLLNFTASTKATAHLDCTNEFRLIMPDAASFNGKDLSADMLNAIKKSGTIAPIHT